MPVKILMPALSPTMEHGNLAKWIKKEGDKIEAGDVIAEIETDKATMEVEAVDEGIIGKIIVSEGTQDVPVNSMIAVILEEGEDALILDKFIAEAGNKSQHKDKTPSQDAIKSENQKETKEHREQHKTPEVKDSKIPDSLANNQDKRVFASPLAKHIASEKAIDLSSIKGTGPHGRIVRDDVISANEQNTNTISTTHSQLSRNSEEYRALPHNNVRKIIAKRLLESKTTVPHFYLSIECTMDQMLDTRAQLNANLDNDRNKKLSVNDFVIAAAAKALQEVPEANASWSDDAILMYNNVDISVAVAIDEGLITPIIRNANTKKITQISTEMKDLAKRARDNTLKPEEFQGGGFSISNLGMYGIKNFNAIINPPQGCILSVGMSSKRAVVVDDKIEIKTVMDVNLSCDHRVVDGVIGARFLAAFKKYIESPTLIFMDL